MEEVDDRQRLPVGPMVEGELLEPDEWGFCEPEFERFPGGWMRRGGAMGGSPLPRDVTPGRPAGDPSG